MGVDVLLELIEGQHPLGNRCRVEPINVLAAIELIEGLQVIPTLQRQDRAFTLDPAFRLQGFVIPIRGASFAPGFILREGLGSLGVRRSGRSLVAIAHRQFRP
ncbi:hypothetical protein D3C85_1297910 [compost metagenome]